MSNHAFLIFLTDQRAIGYLLARRLYQAIPERDAQQEIFTELTGAVSEEEAASWEKMIADWEADKSKKNPYYQKNDGAY